MVKRWSQDREKNVYIFHVDLKFKDKLWIFTFNYIKAKPIVLRINVTDSGYFITEAKNRDLLPLFHRFLGDLSSLKLNFNSAVTIMKECHIVDYIL